MRQGKALAISVIFTLLVSIGVIAFNATYAGNTQESAATVTAVPDADRTTRLTLGKDEDEGAWGDDDLEDQDDEDERANDGDDHEEDEDDEHEEEDD